MRRWIEDRLKELGREKTKTGLGKALGQPSSRVTQIINGERGVKLEELVPLARYLDMDVTEAFRRLTGTELVSERHPLLSDDQSAWLKLYDRLNPEQVGIVRALIASWGVDEPNDPLQVGDSRP